MKWLLTYNYILCNDYSLKNFRYLKTERKIRRKERKRHKGRGEEEKGKREVEGDEGGIKGNKERRGEIKERKNDECNLLLTVDWRVCPPDSYVEALTPMWWYFERESLGVNEV